MILKFLLVLGIICLISSDGYSNATQLTSPCPDTFTYLPRDDVADRWYGRINLESSEDVADVMVKVTLDRPAAQLNSLSEEVVTSDGNEYIISGESSANVSQSLEFYVDYNKSEPIPSVTSISLNNTEICSISDRKARQIFINGFLRPEQSVLFNYEIDQLLCGVTAAQENYFFASEDVFEAVRFPWHAAIFYNDFGKWKYGCGGSLIARQYVITAAHCLQGFARLALRPNDVQVHLGKFYLNKDSLGSQIHEVSNIFIHPTYSRINYANNIALLKLKEPAEYDDFVRPVCLWKGDASYESLIGIAGTAIGWGLNEKNNDTEKLNSFDLFPSSYADCQTSDVASYFQYKSGSIYCAGLQNETRLCQGDSGGGMVFLRQTTRGNVYFLRGVASVPKRFLDRCDDTQNIRFTDVAKYLDFISSYLK